MKRDFLKDFGLEKEQIDAIMSENGKDIENAKAELKELETQVETLKEQVKQRDTQINDLKKSNDSNEDLKKQIEKMQEENKTKDAEHKAELNRLKIDTAIELALKDAKNVKAVKSLLTDVDKFELSADGTIKGLSEQIEALKKSDGYLFNDGKPKLKGAKIGEESDQDGTHTITAKQFKNMKYNERVKLLNENPELYNSLVNQ